MLEATGGKFWKPYGPELLMTKSQRYCYSHHERITGWPPKSAQAGAL
jgi:hypothetical protein